MHFEIPAPHETFDVPLEDGARIRMRRHGNRDGVRLLITHGNGFATDAYYPYWQHLAPRFDLLVFDFRNHGQNVPVEPANHTYEQLSRDLERVVQEVRSRLGARPTAGIFHSMSGRTAMKHAIEIGWAWDALVLFDPPNVPATDHPLFPLMKAFEERLTEWAKGRRRRFAAIDGTDRRISAIARHQTVGRGHARADGALGAAQEPGRQRLRARLRAGERGDHLPAGAGAEPVAARQQVRRAGEADRRRPQSQERSADRRRPTRRSGSRAATTTVLSQAPPICCKSKSRKNACA